MKSYKIKIYPTPAQAERLSSWLITLQQHYNRTLALVLWKQKRYGSPVSKTLCKGSPNPKEPEHIKHRTYIYGIYASAKRRNTWIQDIPSSTVNQTIQARIEAAFDKWRALCKGKKGEDFFKGKPKFAPRDRFTSFQFRITSAKGERLRPLIEFDAKGNRYVNIATARGSKPIGRILCSDGPDTPSEYTNSFCSLQKEPDGWYVCAVFEPANPVVFAPATEPVGIDVNIGSIDLSDGTVIPMPFFGDRYGDEIIKLRKQLSLKRRLNDKEYRSSKRYANTRQRLSLLERRQQRERKAYQAAVATWIVAHYDRIYVEDLKVQNMVKNRHLSKAISGQAWSAFFTILQIKAAEHGRVFLKVDPRYTSQTCSACGWVNKGKDKLGLHVREWDCPKCKVHHHRDQNAAQNVMMRGEEAFADGRVKRPEIKPMAIVIPCDQIELPLAPNLPKVKNRSKLQWARDQRAKRAKRVNKQQADEKKLLERMEQAVFVRPQLELFN